MPYGLWCLFSPGGGKEAEEGSIQHCLLPLWEGLLPEQASQLGILQTQEGLGCQLAGNTRCLPHTPTATFVGRIYSESHLKATAEVKGRTGQLVVILIPSLQRELISLRTDPPSLSLSSLSGGCYGSM